MRLRLYRAFLLFATHQAVAVQAANHRAVQTFLPYKSFRRSARTLDNKRLGKQRVEAYQLLRTLAGETSGWRAHPAVRMWRGYESALARYGMAMCDEWIARGFTDAMRQRIAAYDRGDSAMPPWLGDRRLHRSHQSNLVRKDAGYYRKHFPRVPDDLRYHWPEGAPGAPREAASGE